jgi:hypothetical protein
MGRGLRFRFGVVFFLIRSSARHRPPPSAFAVVRRTSAVICSWVRSCLLLVYVHIEYCVLPFQ